MSPSTFSFVTEQMTGVSAMAFSSQVTRQSVRFKFKSMAGFTNGPVPSQRSAQLAQNHLKMERNRICLRRLTERKLWNDRKLNLAMALGPLADDFGPIQGLPSASDLIRTFYACINEKRMNELVEYIAEDCSFEDCSFPNTMQGKKEVVNFFRQLTKAMGQNVKFIIEHVCEDDKFTAGVNWHLEWRNTQIPFTKGCSFYECSQEGDRLVIKKALVVIESPIKPGGTVLTLLKNVTAIFDEFPSAAEWFLKSFYVILLFLSNIYNRLLLPIIKPFLAGYVMIWDSVAKLFALALKMLIYISKN